MLAAGPPLRNDPVRWRDAEVVAAATMRRVRWNIELLVARLQAVGYDFDPSPLSRPFEPPAADIVDQLARVEAVTGPIPLAMRAFVKHVGQVCLVGDWPESRFAYTDALVVTWSADYFLAEHADWVAERGTEWARPVFTLDFAPDWLHKANVSGGGPYALAVADGAVDGLVVDEEFGLTFIGHLSRAFQWAGFPGWARTEPDWAVPAGPPPAELAQWVAELLPI